MPDGAVVSAGQRGRTLLDIADLTDTPLRRCAVASATAPAAAVRVVAGDLPASPIDHARLGPFVAQGWRLACQHVPRGPLTVERPPAVDDL